MADDRLAEYKGVGPRDIDGPPSMWRTCFILLRR